MPQELPLKEEDLDVVGACFGIKFTPGGAPDGLCELYIEDDENWHFKCVFNRLWLTDLSQVVSNAKIKLMNQEKVEPPKAA